MRQAHWAFDECELCGSIDISIHHIYPRGQGGDDVWENLVPLCGDGTRGCHGGVEAGRDVHCYPLGLYILKDRPDTLKYLETKLKTKEAVKAWLHQRFGVGC